MRVLLDECLPRRLGRVLTGCDVRTVPEAGWAGKQNGELLQLASASFDVFVTMDRNLQYQQNLLDAGLASSFSYAGRIASKTCCRCFPA